MELGESYNHAQTVGDSEENDRLRSILLTIHCRTWYHSPAKSQPKAGILLRSIGDSYKRQ